MSTSPRYQFKM